MTTVTDYLSFRVVSKAKEAGVNVGEDRLAYLPCRWFRCLDGAQKGLEFPLPVEHPAYDEEMQDVLTNLTEGDTVTMKCRSLNERNTVGRCEAIASLDA